MASRTAVLVVLAGCSPTVGTAFDAGPTAVDARDARDVDAVTIDATTCTPTPSGIGGRWRGEMNTTDDGGSSYTGTVVGANFGYTPGRHGYAFLFNGTTNVVSINDADTLWPSASFTIEAWAKTLSGGVVFSKYQCGGSCPASTSNALWGLSISAAGAASFQFRSDAVSTIVSATDTNANTADGQWHYLVGVRDASASKALLYVDGVLATTTQLTAAQAGPMTNTDAEVDPVVIGGQTIAGMAGYNRFFNGAIDEVAYYTTAISATQVAAITVAPQGECP